MKNSLTPGRQPSAADVQRLVGLLNAGQWAQAEAEVRKALAAHPQALVFLNLLGSALAGQSRWAEAIESFSRVAAVAPQSMETHSQLGMLYSQLGRREDAVASYRKAVALKPDFAELHCNLGILLGQLGRHAEAADSYAQAVAVKPALAVAHYNRGTALQALGRLDEAAQSYRRVLALQPASAEAHSNLGAVLQAQGALDAAIDSYRSALAIQPDPRVHFNLGTAYRNEGRLAESVRSFESALALAPVYPDALNNLGEVLRDQGRLDEAVACFEQALAQDPDTSEANYNLAVLLYDRGRPDQAARYFEASRLRDWQQRVLLCLYKTEQFNAFRAGLERLLAAPEAHAAPLLATLSAHHAANFGVTDHCDFCPHPLDFVSHGRIDALAGERSALREQLLIDIASAEISARKQGRLHHGIQSSGNLFKRPEASFRALSGLIAEQVERYRQGLAGAEGVFARDFPATTEFSSSWYVKMQTGGHLTSHIHETGWLSGAVYLAMPPRDAGSDAGSIEFSTDGDGYPRRHVDFPRRVCPPAVGDIVLFPSSLFHRTVPFSATEERICIAFDIAPRMA
ncbi:MAG TPA: tetratricopeptide repeat protein [Burkholderiaceae bacterium]|nr:tetratricopeptide repeat protein [Burkholderiaceae bacterium]